MIVHGLRMRAFLFPQKGEGGGCEQPCDGKSRSRLSLHLSCASFIRGYAMGKGCSTREEETNE